MTYKNRFMKDQKLSDILQILKKKKKKLSKLEIIEQKKLK